MEEFDENIKRFQRKKNNPSKKFQSIYGYENGKLILNVYYYSICIDKFEAAECSIVVMQPKQPPPPLQFNYWKISRSTGPSRILLLRWQCNGRGRNTACGWRGTGGKAVANDGHRESESERRANKNLKWGPIHYSAGLNFPERAPHAFYIISRRPLDRYDADA